MYERVTELRPLDFIILGLVCIAILLEAITYWELGELRSAVRRIEIVEGR